MISYFWYDIIYDITIWLIFSPFLRELCVILPMISYTYHTKSAMISLYYDINHDIIADMLWYCPLISLYSDIIAIWYQGFYDMFPYIMSPARRAGAGWGRQGPGAPPPPASPSPRCWGRVFSWTATGQRPWSCSWTCSVAVTSSIRWKISGKFQVDSNYKFELIISGPLLGYLQSCSPCWPVSSCRPAALSSGLSHWQSLRSARESAGPTRIRCQSGLTASDRWLVVSRYKRSEPELVTSLHER